MTADAFAGTGALLRFMLRRDRIRLPAWVAGFAVFTLYLVVAIPAAYGDDLDSVSALLADPAGRLLVGPGYGFDALTLERLVTNGYGLYLMLLAALMTLLLTVRHTRADEQSGRAELLRAGAVGRAAAPVAAMLTAAIAAALAGLAVTAVLIGVGGYGIAGALLFGASITVVGLVWVGIAGLCAQLARTSRLAAGVAGGALGAAFVIRAGGDVVQPGGSTLSWASPLGWAQQTAPYVLDRWWPLAPGLALAVATATAAVGLAARRDLGAGLTTDRPGPAVAGRTLRGPWGLATRLQRASILGWAISLATAGAVFGVFAEPMTTALEDLPDVLAEVFGTDDLLDGYLAYMAVFMGLFASTYAILAVQAVRNEETSGRMEPLLALPIGRGRWLALNLAVTAGAVVAIMALTGVATGLGVAGVTGRWGAVISLTAAHLNHAPASLLVLAIAGVLYATAPRLLGAAWVVVGYGLVVGTFGPLLNLPAWAFRLSPYEHPAEVPLERFTLVPLIVLGGGAAIGLWAAASAFSHREVLVR